MQSCAFAHAIVPPHELTPMQCTAHVVASPQLTPCPHELAPHVTSHAIPAGHVTCESSHCMSAQSMTQVSFMHVPPAAMHAACSQGGPFTVAVSGVSADIASSE